MDSIDGFIQCGFLILEEKQDEEIVLGFLLGLGGIKVVTPQEFIEFNEANYAKGVINFRIIQHGNASLLSTETRVHCDNVTKIIFTLYWSLISRFSALTRIEMLRLIKLEAELLS